MFKANFCNPDDKACTRRLHAMLRQWMVRRTQADTLLGAPIMKLPPTHQSTTTVDFNAVERVIYDTVRKRYIGAINKSVARPRMLSTGDELTEYPGFLVKANLRNLPTSFWYATIAHGRARKANNDRLCS